jgi:hypothetical protein
VRDPRRTLLGDLERDGLPAVRSEGGVLTTDARRNRPELPAYASELNPVEGLWANLKGGELANFAGDTVAEVADQACHGIQRVCDSDSLVAGFLAHTGLTLEDEPVTLT